MTVNLFGRSSSYERSLEQIAAAFGDDAVWAFRPTREGNTIVLAPAQRQPARARGACRARAKASRLAGACPRRKWLRVFKPAQPDSTPSA